jgi:hypothetical protein
VVSIEDVTTRLGIFSFHEKLVSGAPPLWPCTLDCYGNTDALGARPSGENERKTYP